MKQIHIHHGKAQTYFRLTFTNSKKKALVCISTAGRKVSKMDTYTHIHMCKYRKLAKMCLNWRPTHTSICVNTRQIGRKLSKMETYTHIHMRKYRKLAGKCLKWTPLHTTICVTTATLIILSHIDIKSKTQFDIIYTYIYIHIYIYITNKKSCTHTHR
jgi:hypothetical protein